MTKELHPVLGSGALRERITNLRSFEMEGMLSRMVALDDVLAALSLSSPIEPPPGQLADILRRIEDRSIQRAHPPEGEVSTDEPFECVLCGAEAPTTQVYHNVTCPVADMALLLARPTSQASSEIRERVEAELAAIRKDYGRTNWFTLMEHFCKRVTDALAPSRQGAPDNPDHYGLDRPRQGAGGK